MKTLYETIETTAEKLVNSPVFFGHGTDNAWDEAVQLVTTACLSENPEQPVTPKQHQQINDWLDTRINQRTPLPYILKQCYFTGLPFYIDERALIPRSPIGELIEQQFTPWIDHTKINRILDMCTGSGCIAIACAYAFENATIDAVDISADALAVAQRNIQQHQLENRVTPIQSDGFNALQGKTYDLIISNSPYVDAEDFSSMPVEYQHEPALALESGADGLDFTRRLLAESAQHLTPIGSLIAEVGNSMIALEKAFPDTPFIWFEFERGGHGVFMLNQADLANP